MLALWRAEIDSGALTPQTGPTFFDAAEAYLLDNGDARFLPPIVDRIGGKPLAALTQDVIDSLAHSLYPAATPATRNRQVYTPISAVLKHAGVDQKLRRPKGWRGRVRSDWMEPEQAFRLLEAARKIDAEFGAFLTLLLYTGMRLSEALGMMRSDTGTENAYALVRATKNGEPRGVFLPPAAVEAVRAQDGAARRDGRVWRFTKCGRLYSLLKAAKAAAGDDLGFVTFHTFRHTWATWMRRYGGLDRDGLVGTGAWKDAASAARYAHVVVSEEAQKALLLPVRKACEEV